MTDYCTVAEVKEYAQDQEMNDGLIIRLIPSISRMIDRFCRRSFAATAATEVYDWPETGVIRLRKDLISVTAVTTNAGQTFTANQVRLRPQGGPPYFTLQLKSELGYTFSYGTTPYDAVEIAGSWGYRATVPDEIRLAAKIWVTETYVRSDARGLDKVGGGAIEASLTKLTDKPPADVEFLLKHFRKVLILSTGEGNAQGTRVL